MDRRRLNLLYRAAASWPKNEGELAMLAEKLRVALEIPAVALWVPKIGLRIAWPELPAGLFAPLAEALRYQCQLLPPTSGPEPLELDLSSVPGVPKQLGMTAYRLSDSSSWLFLGGAGDSENEIVLAHRLALLEERARSHDEIAIRDQFLSIASHELKTPLTSIYGILQLQERMLRAPKDGAPPPVDEKEKQRSFFRIVIRQVERLNELIDGLLDVSRIQNGRFRVEPTVTDLGPLFRETLLARLSVIAREAEVSLQIDAPKSLLANVDPVRFEELVTNLGMNAIRFSPEGGLVWMRLRVEGSSLVLTVRDQGPSVPDADRERIFQPFETAQRTSRLRGLGLGLFISRQIAQLHGGNVQLTESVPGKGNTFEARFPSSISESTESSPPLAGTA